MQPKTLHKAHRPHIALNNMIDDELNEECGIFGIFNPTTDIARSIFFALYALQHRGQEGAGITTVGKRGKMSSHRGMGLAMQIFTENEIKRLKGRLGIGHTRYSTAGGSNLHNAQPFVVETKHGAVAIAHNGQLALANKLRQGLMQKGIGLFTSNDSEIVAQMFAAQPENAEENNPLWEKRFSAFMREVEGAYSICVLVKDALFGIRDRLGMRPLSIGIIKGENNQHTYVLSSESCALTTIGATLVRDVSPGEIVRLDKNGITSSWGVPPSARTKSAFCVFEYVYFARPDSVINGILVHAVRQYLGRQLAREAPCECADVVIGVPDSSIPMAIGYSQESGIPFTEGLCKNRYIGRTFIQPSQDMRMTLVKLKYNPLVQNLKGKNVVMVDDSLVRGNTISQLICLVRSAGAKTVHIRIASPPIRFPCYMGIDMKTKEELIAGHKTVPEITALIGADSLAYLSHEGMINSIKQTERCEEYFDYLTETTSIEKGVESVEEIKLIEKEATFEEIKLNEKDVKSVEETKVTEKEVKHAEETKATEKEVKHVKETKVTEMEVKHVEETKATEKEVKHVEETKSIETKATEKEVKHFETDTKLSNEEEKLKDKEVRVYNLGFCSACFSGNYPLDIEDINYVCGLDL